MTRTGTLPDKGGGRTTAQKSELLKRTISAIAFAALALGVTIASLWTFVLIMFVAGVVLAWEWGRLVRGNGFDAIALIQAVSTGAVAILVAFGRLDLAALLLGASFATVGFAHFATPHVSWSTAGLLVTALPIGALVWLRGDPAYGTAAVLFVFAIAWATDTVAYAVGRLVGGPKLAPRISPNKTWSGFIGGVLVPGLVGYGFALALGGTSVLGLALVGVVLALACQMGDLLESAVKRRFGVKDMSSLIPGHGGLFDRIDGLLLAGLIAGLIALRDVANPGQGLLIW